MISCLTITRETRFAELTRAIRCFSRQTHRDRELVVVHDGSAVFDKEVRKETALYPDDAFLVHRVEQNGLTLGALRNMSLSLARGDIVCQWDDDDLYHPQRLEIQLCRLQDDHADFCFLTDQLHYFEPTGELFWDDWEVEGYPGNLIQGTLLGRAAGIGRYQDLPKGEDTGLLGNLLAQDCRIATVKKRGFLYIYVYNGKNAWDLQHHAAQSAWKRLKKEALLRREQTLRRYLGDYELPWKRVVMPYEGGFLEIL